MLNLLHNIARLFRRLICQKLLLLVQKVYECLNILDLLFNYWQIVFLALLLDLVLVHVQNLVKYLLLFLAKFLSKCDLGLLKVAGEKTVMRPFWHDCQNSFEIHFVDVKFL